MKVYTFAERVLMRVLDGKPHRAMAWLLLEILVISVLHYFECLWDLIHDRFFFEGGLS